MRAACCLIAALSAASPARAEAPTLVFRHGKVSGFEKDFRAILDRFEAQSGFKVRGEVLPNDVGQQHQLYAVNLEGGSDAFDVLGMDIIWVAEFARAGWIADLEAAWPPEQRKAFLPGTVEAATFAGKPWAVPWFTDSGMLYYRKDLLAKHGRRVPETWAELAETARAVLDGEKDPRLSGFVWQGRQYEGLVCAGLEFVHSNATRLVDGHGRYSADPVRFAEALGFMRGLIDSKVSPQGVLATDEETARHVFGNGNAVFMRNWPYAYGIYSKPGSAIEGRFGVAALPAFPGGESSPTLGGWFLAVNRFSKHPDAAAKLALYMASEPVQRELFLKASYLPTRASLYADAELVKKAPQLAAFRAGLSKAKPRPVTPFYTSLSDILQSELSAVLAGIKGPDEAARAIEVQMRPLEEAVR